MRSVALQLCALLALSLATSASAAEKVTFQLNTTPSPPDHTAFEVALEKGFYRDAGLEVTLEPGTGSSNTLKLVGAGKAPLGFVDAGTMILGVAQGIPVKSIAVVNQVSPMAVIFKEAKGYRKITDLRGKSIATTQAGSLTRIFPIVLRSQGMTTDDVKMVYTGNPTAKEVAMLADNVDAYLGFYTENAMRNLAAGHKVAWIKFADADVNLLNLAIVANTDWLKNNAAVARAFVRATQKGIQYTVDHPDEAAAIFHKNHSRDFSADVVLRMLQAGNTLLQTPRSKGRPFGVTADEDWRATERLLAEHSQFSPAASIAVYHTNEFAAGN
jgi:NitT/TauT family transport system substrate-binding protein